MAKAKHGEEHQELKLAPWAAGMHAYFNPEQAPFKHWSERQYGESGPACFNYAFPPPAGVVMANPLPEHLPPGWKLLPAGADLRFGDRILYGVNNTTLHSAVVWKIRDGVATEVQQIIGPGLPVVCSNPNDASLLHGLKPFAVVRPPRPVMRNCLSPENAVRVGGRRASVYTEEALVQWKVEHR